MIGLQDIHEHNSFSPCIMSECSFRKKIKNFLGQNPDSTIFHLCPRALHPGLWATSTAQLTKGPSRLYCADQLYGGEVGFSKMGTAEIMERQMGGINWHSCILFPFSRSVYIYIIYVYMYIYMIYIYTIYIYIILYILYIQFNNFWFSFFS